ncbi:MAG: Asp-tRNA(Asn)/Glu-tRNA(Gln) amidotransferase subunit GatA [Anaerolineae bacterium]|jgi:aspartyl-tRNA(Asn)/glutamyl-tRNA(Gln) amidotransferase subunit A|nr:Asp-tRNA(Asn)/Glu-tRNA(Gln) amidotransferase subunit GatA [Anaerolineae bacterium]
MDLHALTIRKASALLRSGEITSVALTQAVLDRIAAVDPAIKAYVTVCEDAALQEATAADARLQRGGPLTPLTGIPYGVKDCLSTTGVRTTCSSRILENYVPRYDATVISRLREAGAVLVGKQNMDEFGMGSSCENSAFFATRNPWAFDRVPGGSSGGSAAAVASGMGLFALGEDTGGSIRMPASFCGVTGLKPTYGRVPRYGLLALVSSFDSIGPLTHDAWDAALVLGAIAGRDPRDSTSVGVPVPGYTSTMTGERLDGVRLGVPIEYFAKGIDPAVECAVRTAITHLEALGAEVREVSLPHTEHAISIYYLILTAEASSNLARFDGVRFGLSEPPEGVDIVERYLKTRGKGFGPEVKRRIMLGTFALSAGYYDAYYLRAQRVRTLLRQDFAHAFEVVDALIAPVSPTCAFKIGEKVDDPLQMYLSDIHVVAANPGGVCSLAVPCGFAEGLPVGMQIIGPPMGEAGVLSVGAAYQATTDWHTRRPMAE